MAQTRWKRTPDSSLSCFRSLPRRRRAPRLIVALRLRVLTGGCCCAGMLGRCGLPHHPERQRRTGRGSCGLVCCARARIPHTCTVCTVLYSTNCTYRCAIRLPHSRMAPRGDRRRDRTRVKIPQRKFRIESWHSSRPRKSTSTCQLAISTFFCTKDMDSFVVILLCFPVLHTKALITSRG